METHTTNMAHQQRSRVPLVGSLIDRVDDTPPWALILQLFVGLGWLRAAAEKVVSGTWWRGDTIVAFLQDHDAIGWYQPFAENVVSANPAVIAAFVLVAQIAVGISLLFDHRPCAALLVGMFLNLHFVAAGAVNPSAFYLLMQGALLLWIAESASRVVLHRWASIASVGAGVLALVSSPFVMTLEPEAVVHDPAIMLVTLGSLTVLAAYLIERQPRPAPVEG